jgi:inorganic pyrophosphatase
MVNEGTFSGCLIEARVLGVFKMSDRGQEDWKLLAVPNTDPLFSEILDLEDVANPFLREVSHFFETYKQLDGVTVQVGGWHGRQDAMAALHDALTCYMAKNAVTAPR